MSRQHLIENIVIEPDAYKKGNLPLEESVNVAYGSVNESYKALGVYTFPVSRPDQRNLNNRIYPSQLWENVINSGKAENTFGLMNHPEDDGSVKDIWCVWKNLRFSPDHKLVIADAYLIGHWGQLVLEALEAGGKIGLSSSGWGDFLSDNTTLDPDSFEIERVADFVFNPSYEVYGTVEGKKEEFDNSVLEQKVDSPKEETEENKRMEEKILEKTSPSLEERNFKLNIKNMFKEARKISDIGERINECRTLLSYFGRDTENDLYKEIEESITKDNNEIFEGYAICSSLKENNSKLSEDIKSLNEQIEAVKKENGDLQEKVEKCCTLLDSLKEYSKKQKDLYDEAVAEKNAMVSVSQYKESLVYSEELEEERDNLKKQIKDLRKSLMEAKRKIQRLLKEKAKKSEEDDDEDDDEKDVNVDVNVNTDSDEPEDDSEDDDDEDDDMDDAGEEKKESCINPQVLSYYEDLEYANPKVSIIKEEILSKRTLMEAQKTYLKLRSLVEATSTDQMKLAHFAEKTYAEPVKKKPFLHEGWV